MSNVSKLLKLPHVISKWSDGENDRLHLFLQMLSGTTVDDFVGNPVVTKRKGTQGQNTFTMKMKLNELLLEHDRLFDHPEFEGFHFQRNKYEPKFIARSIEVNKLMSGKSEIILTVEIPLGEYDWTPEDISGHSPYLPIRLPEVDTNGRETGAKVFIMMFDFMIPRKQPSFTTKKRQRKKRSPTRRTLG